MTPRGYAALAAVAVLVIAGAGAALLVTSDNPDDPKISKEYYEYDFSKGWGSWNPILTNTSSSNMTGSAYISQVADYWYNTIYDEPVDYSKYSIEDVPEDFLAYESLVSKDTKGNLVIQSMIRDEAGVYNAKPVTITKLPDYIICPGSVASTVYTVMAVANGTDYEDYDSKVVTEFWNKIYAGDSGLATKFTSLYGVPSDEWHGVKMSSCTNILKYKEQYMTVFGDIKDEGKNVCFIGQGSIGAEADTWMSEQMAVFDSYDILINVTDLEQILANIEVVACLLGYEDTAKNIVDSIRVRLYAISQESELKESKYDYVRSALYINVDANKARGLNTLANDLMELFHMTNCVTHTGNQEVKEEVIILAQPDIIVFVSELSPDDPGFDLKTALRIKDA